jgi:Uma2 family endonuclease
MNVHATYPTTPEEFLVWNEAREGKREFVAGRVIEMMINVTESHYRLASRLLFQLNTQLDDRNFIAGSADFGVRTAEGVRYPDVMVHKPGNGKALATSQPLLIAEILSPSTMADDFGPKARDYLALPSLAHYLILSQDEVAIWVWSRDDSSFSGPELHRDPANLIALDGLGVTIDPKRLYSGVAAM